MGNKNNIRKCNKRKNKAFKSEVLAKYRRLTQGPKNITVAVDCELPKSANESFASTLPQIALLENVDVAKELDGQLEPDQNIKTKVYPTAALKKKKVKPTKAQDENIFDASERIIIDKNYFFEKLKQISGHAPQFGCNLTNLNITGETKIGLCSKLKLSCNMCKADFIINTSEPHPTENLDINTAAVSGITNAGIGLEQFQGLCIAMNLPTLTQQMFDKKHVQICQQWETTAYQTMAAAAERERQAAIEEGRVKDGIAVIDVVADACWSKRSYKNNYTSLSGAAAIVGRKFGEVLFLGVKNKYCCICSRAENKRITPKQHVCYKNYTGSSSGMEAEIIAEGFKNSIEMYNIIYGRVIADGDSSTYSKILEDRPYKNLTVEKIECRNHILRNMCNKLVAVGKDTKYPLEMRKMITTQRILAIRKVICLAIKKHNNDDAELGVRINNLYADISNSYNHAFGHHDECLDHYCSSEKKSEDLLPKVKNTSFWSKIQYIVGTVARHSRSLINDYDSNIVEQFNSIIAKFVGGKRTNLIQRQTYQSRCAAAVVAHNTKMPLYNLQKSILGKSPKSKIKAFEEKKKKRNELRRNIKHTRKLCFNKEKAMNDKHYGTDSCQKPDMDEDAYKMVKETFLKNLEKTDTERAEIERKTVLQRDSSEWLELRRNLLTASNFGKVINRRPTTSASIVKTLLYKSNLSHVVSIKHGIDNETIALEQLATQERVEINPCGLFIDSEIPYLAATPDGLIGNDTVVEIKCPLSAFKIPVKEAVQKKKIKFWNMNADTMVINKNNPWYYQIQGQLHITKRKMCLFAVWCGDNQPLKVEKIMRDDDFWQKNMVGKLTDFYMHHILPELIDPRQTRNMPLRQPILPTKQQLDEPIHSGPSEKPTLAPSQLVDITNTFGPGNVTQKVLSIEEY